MAHLAERQIETIDLVSSDDEAEAARVEQEAVQQPEDEDVQMLDYYSPPPAPAQLGLHHHMPQRWEPDLSGSIVLIDGEEVFIPDEMEPAGPAPPVDPAVETSCDEELALALANEETAAGASDRDNHNIDPAEEPIEVTAERSLQRVLAIFPDISHDYAIKLYNDFEREGEGDYEVLAGDARLENIIEQLISNPTYPKQEKGKKALKRKRQDSVDNADHKRWENADRRVESGWRKRTVQSLLKTEFPDIPVWFIDVSLLRNKHLYQTYAALYACQEENNGTNKHFGKGRPSSKAYQDAETVTLASIWPDVMAELEAARVKVKLLRSEKEAQETVRKAEKENLARAIAAGETTECTACYDDLPMNRQIHCDGEVAHFVCFDCAMTYIKSEVGESRCRVVCTAGCGAGFANNQLALLSDKQLLEKLAQLQQEKDIRDAGLEDLEECPFCDYKAIMPPVEEDFEFRCSNPECEKVSCRRCKSVSHIPLSCEEHAQDNKVNNRHKIEEAMTAALIRKCNKCSKSFIKDYGCNKMSCPNCGNLQCYVCSDTIKDYNHFDQTTRGPGAPNPNANSKSNLCPLYDNVEERHEREVKEAETAARAQVVEDNPDLTAEDLEIKVSDAVKKSAVGRGGRPPLNVAAYVADPMEGLYNFWAGRDEGHAAAEDVGRQLEAVRRHVAEVEHDVEAVHRRILKRQRHRHRRGQGLRGGGQEPEVDRVIDYAHQDLGAAEAAFNVRAVPNATLAQIAAQAQAPPAPPPVQQQPVQGRVQGYIPVIGFDPVPAPLRQAPQLNDPPLPPPYQYYAAHAGPGAGGVFDDNVLFGLFPEDAPAQPQQGYNQNDDANNNAGLFGEGNPQPQPNYVNQPGPAGAAALNLRIPGAFPQQTLANQPPPPLTPAQAHNFRALEMLRQNHSQQLLARQARDREAHERRRVRMQLNMDRIHETQMRRQGEAREEQQRRVDLEALQRQVRAAGREREEREGR